MKTQAGSCANTSGKKQQQQAVQERSTAALICVPIRQHAKLCMCCRDANRVNEEWFTDMDKVRAAVGMVDEAPEPTGSTEKVSSRSLHWV